MGHDGAGELGRLDHGALEVDVGIDEARAKVAAAEVHNLARLVCPKANYATLVYGDVGPVDLTGEDIDQTGVGQEEVYWVLPPGSGDHIG
jgi:hypothetical protein